MLVFVDEEVEPILASQKIRCSICEKRSSPWNTAKEGETEKVPMCGWCVMYAGSEWGHLNRDELLHVGRTCVGIAVQHSKSMPVLDERGRLPYDAAERYMMGIAFTSKMLHRPLSKMEKMSNDDS